MLNEQRLTKLAMITGITQVFAKQAEALTGEPFNDEEIAEVSARADAKVPDEVVSAMPAEDAVSLMQDAVANAATETKNALENKNDPGTPEGNGIQANGTGSVAQVIMKNPNAKTDGVTMTPDVPVIETNLMGANDSDNKLSSFVATPVLAEALDYAIKTGNSVVRLDVYTGDKTTQMQTKKAFLTNILIKLAEETPTAVSDATVETIAKAVSSLNEGDAVTPAEATGETVESAKKIIKDKTDSVDKIKSDTGLEPNPNPESGDAAVKNAQIRSIIERYASKH